MQDSLHRKQHSRFIDFTFTNLIIHETMTQKIMTYSNLQFESGVLGIPMQGQII